MTLTFRYKTVKRPDGTLVKTPSIPITLIGEATFKTIGLIDSGADLSVIPREVAVAIGLKLSEEITFAYGIGGKVRSVEENVSALISKGHENYRFNMPVKVILDDYDFPILLGRSGFFDNFVITFYQQDGKVLLKRKQKE